MAAQGKPELSRLIKIAFSDFWHGNRPAEVMAGNPIYRMLSRHFELELSPNPDFLVYSCFGKRYLSYRCVRIFYTGENVRPDFSECDYAFSFDFPTDHRNYRLPLYRFYAHFDRLLEPRDFTSLPSGRKFCNFVYSNSAAPERIEFFERLNHYRRVDSGGRLLNNVGGRVADKLAFQAQYRFSIAFENSCHPGYTTEKVLDALVAGTVPIYWGNPEIARDFNPDCLINCHDFADFDAVVKQVEAVDRDPLLYRKYLEAPVFPDHRLPDFLREDAIVGRFEDIFSASQRNAVARRSDPVKRYFLPSNYVLGARNVYRRMRRALAG